MSIEIMTRVWKQSKQGGSQLLLLLAIADNANDGGFAWPGQEYLAKKIRMSTKSIPRLTKKLQEAGELFIHGRADQGKVTQYIVVVGMDWPQLEETLKCHLKFDETQLAFTKRGYMKIIGGDKLGGGQVGGGTQLCPGGVDIAVSRGVDIAVSTEPSLTIKEPSFSENSQNPKNQHTSTERHALNKLGRAIAHSKDAKAQTANELRTITLIGADIADITKTDILTVDTGELAALAGLTIRLSAKGNIATKLTAYEAWWYANDWRGKQGQSPTVKTLGSTWGQFEADRVAPAANTGPTLTEAQKTRLAELTAQFSPK